MADTASTENHHESINRTIPTSSASSFNIPSFSLSSIPQGSSTMKENGLSHNSSHIKSSQSLQKLLHYTNGNENSLTTTSNHLQLTINNTTNNHDNDKQRDNDESRILRELLFGMQGIETPRLLANDTIVSIVVHEH